MVFDLVAGTRQTILRSVDACPSWRAQTIVMFDSGLGGLSVFPEVQRIAPHASFVYVADDQVFPYGALGEADLVARVTQVMTMLIARYHPDIVVIACHTASTAVLPPLRQRWPDIAFVGTVPAIKPAVAASASKHVSVLATAGTVARDYTRELVRTFAGDCRVTLVAARGLAGMAERAMRGEPVEDDAIAAEIAPAFVSEGERRTDTIVLACTHFPLLMPRLIATAPWPVHWIDPAPAIARRVRQVLGPATAAEAEPDDAIALFTSNTAPGRELTAFLAARGLRWQSNTLLAALPRADVDR